MGGVAKKKPREQRTEPCWRLLPLRQMNTMRSCPSASNRRMAATVPGCASTLTLASSTSRFCWPIREGWGGLGGQSGTLGLLLVGALGMLNRRRRQA